MPVPLTPEKKKEQELRARTTHVAQPGYTHDTTTTTPAGHVTQNTQGQSNMRESLATADATSPGHTAENQAAEQIQAEPTVQTPAGSIAQNQPAAGRNTEEHQQRHVEQTGHIVAHEEHTGQTQAGTGNTEERRIGHTQQPQPGHTTRDTHTGHTTGDNPTGQPDEKRGQREQQQVDPDVVAGYQDCLKETIR